MSITKSGIVDCNRDAFEPIAEGGLAALHSRDWYCAFTPAASIGYDVGRIKRIIAADDGENDVSSWIGLFEADDGRLVFVASGCDYTGWDCQSGGEAFVCDSIDEARQNIDVNYLVRLNIAAGGAQ